MQRNWVCVSALALSIVLLMVVKLGASCDPCTNCSADPVFVQKDSRNPELALVARDLRKLGSDPGVIDSIAAVEGPSSKGLRIVIFQEDGKRVQVDIPRVELLAPAIAAFLRLPPSHTTEHSKASSVLVDPKAFLRGE